MNDLNRQIYIGDMIQLTIDRAYASEKEILDAFHELEVVAVKEGDQVYEVTLRSFEPGIYKTELAGRQVEILVVSTLDALNRETLFEPEPLIGESFQMPYMTLMFAAAALGIVALIAYMALWFGRGKKQKSPTAYETFVALGEKEVKGEGDLAIISKAFKVYLQNSGIVRAKDTTTFEILQGLQESSIPQVLKEEIADCLDQSDAIHYRPDKGSPQVREALKDRFLGLAKALAEWEKEVGL